MASNTQIASLSILGVRVKIQFHWPKVQVSTGLVTSGGFRREPIS